ESKRHVPRPFLYNFVLSSGGGDQGMSELYGAVLVVYETGESSSSIPVGICILSDLPLFSQMREWIANIFCKSQESDNGKEQSRTLSAKDFDRDHLEQLLFASSAETVKRELALRNPSEELEPLDFSMEMLFKTLSIDNVIRLFACCL